jgi:hypothetical protein
MIPADQLQLITAAVDGELSVGETRALRRLLAASPDARTLYEKLQADRDRIRALPQLTPPANLRAQVLARLAAVTPPPRAKPGIQPNQKPAARTTQPARPVQPARAPQSLPFRRTPSWVPIAVAASLLLCITAGSFAFFRQGPSKTNASTANALPAPQDTISAVPSPTALIQHEAVRPDPRKIAYNDVVPVPPAPMPKVAPPEQIAVAPEPRPVRSDLYGSSYLPPPRPFDFIRVRVPFLRTIAELEREDIRQELIDDLGRGDAAFRLDLFVRDTERGTVVFRNAAKVTGLTVFADASTLDKLKKGQVASVVVYTESLTAKELAALFAHVSAEDAKFSPRVCDSLHVAPVLHSEETELKQILGVDAGLYKRALGSNPTGTGIGSSGTGQGGVKDDKVSDPKPISAGTVDSVVQSVGNPGAKAGENTAILLTWHPNVSRTSSAMSVELKQFLARRPTERKPNAIPTIIVIRMKG